jgi:hypothetical protein
LLVKFHAIFLVVLLSSLCAAVCFDIRLFPILLVSNSAKKNKAIPGTTVEAHRVVRRQGFHIDDRHTDGGEVNLTRRPLFTPHEDSWYSFLLDAESTAGP